ncbi:TPA: amino acid adenylation domain-containing protein [Vibrio vulnificus]|nr:amino acid adenylation domain-containing protein [Vibrio vulnificus]
MNDYVSPQSKASVLEWLDSMDNLSSGPTAKLSSQEILLLLQSLDSSIDHLDALIALAWGNVCLRYSDDEECRIYRKYGSMIITSEPITMKNSDRDTVFASFKALYEEESDGLTRVFASDNKSLTSQWSGHDMSRNNWFGIQVKTEPDGVHLTVISSMQSKEVFRFQEMLLKRFIGSMQALASAQSTGLPIIPSLSAEQHDQLLAFGCQPERERPAEFLSSFTSQANRHPDKAAVVDADGNVLTYSQLNDRACVIADFLLTHHRTELDVTPLVPIFADRSHSLMVAMIAVLKARLAYVPLSSTNPDAYTRHVLDDLATNILLTSSDYADHFHGWEILFQDGDVLVMSQPQLKEESANSHNQYKILGRDIAYCLYTSGTTGKPKGALIESKGLDNLLSWYVEDLTINETDNVLVISNVAFDLTQKNLLAPLWAGATLHFCQPFGYDPDCILETMDSRQISFINCAPSAFYPLVEHGKTTTFLKGVSRVLLGGEAFDIGRLSSWYYDLNTTTQLYNVYGPTECTAVATFYAVPKIPKVDLNHRVPVGRPIPGVDLFVVDDEGCLLPTGDIGELYIGGVGVSLGYINRPELSERQFIQWETRGIKPSRVYKTGDRVRWRHDGQLEFMGRADSQVKIRGHRVELSEINQVLQSLPGIRESVVDLVQIQRRQLLTAYVVRMDGHSQSEQSLLVTLKQRLPEYMVPVRIVFLANLPLTSNGKVDRFALPKPKKVSRSQASLAPRTYAEETLCELWEEVLDLDNVGVDQNFFSLGGNSADISVFCALAQQRLGMTLRSTDVYASPTVAELASMHQSSVTMSITKRIKGHPVSFSQERMLFIDQIEEQSDLYHIPLLLRLGRETDLARLEAVIERIYQSESVLHACYKQQSSGEYQVCFDTPDLRLSAFDVDNEEELLGEVRKQCRKPFDLHNEGAMRASIMRSKECAYLLLVWHHIAFDGKSISLFLHLLSKYYLKGTSNDDEGVNSSSINYTDYAAWQRIHQQGRDIDTAREYWKSKLARPVDTMLLTDYPRPSKACHQAKVVDFEWDAKLTESLKSLAVDSNTTLYTVLLSAFYFTLSAYTGQRDQIVGTTSDNREGNQLKQLMGYFATTLPLRLEIMPNWTTEELISAVRRVVIDAKIHEALPFEEMVDVSGCERFLDRHPLFQVLFGFQNFRIWPKGKELDGIEIDNSILDRAKIWSSKFDLDVIIDNCTDHSIKGRLTYAESLFASSTIAGFLDTYQFVAQQMATDPTRPLAQLDFVNEHHQARLVAQYHQDYRPYSSRHTLHERFLQQVLSQPERYAVSDNNQRLTYRELNSRADVLAGRIRETLSRSCGPKVAPRFVPLLFNQGVDLIVAMLATLKANAAYVPMSTEWPAERIAFVLRDTQAEVVLTQEGCRPVLSDRLCKDANWGGIILCADQAGDVQESGCLLVGSEAQDAAYVIYTSGTTGTPKGVVQPHCNVVRLLDSTQSYYQFSSSDKWLLGHACTFDFSVWEIWGALVWGGELCIPDQMIRRDFHTLALYCKERGITVLNQTPSAFYSLSEALLELGDGQLPLRHVIFGGDKLLLSKLKSWFEAFGDISPVMTNMYGITETTVHVTLRQVLGSDDVNTSNIGRPIEDQLFYVLDEQGRFLPQGCPGELCVGGAGLAIGYLNQPELTANKFVHNPYAPPGSEARIYKSGDIGRLRPDGSFDYLGRRDFQVKVRGHRIELGEVENCLCLRKDVQQAVVVVHERDTDRLLIGYLVMVQGYAFNERELHEDLLKLLPPYMVPSKLIEIEQVPLNLNGKVDRKALPTPDFTSSAMGKVMPKDGIETALARIWELVLGVKRIGIDDNYFQLGGDSIISIRILAAAKKQGMTFTLTDLFTHPTIRSLSQCVSEFKEESNYVPFSLLSESQVQRVQSRFDALVDAYPASELQKGMLLENTLNPDAYHDLTTYRFFGQLERSHLESCLDLMVRQHDILRIRFTPDRDLGYIVLVYGEYKPDIEYVEEGLSDIYDKQCKQTFDITKTGLYRIVVHPERDGGFYVTLVCHHSILDGWSVASFFQQLSMLYGDQYDSKQAGPGYAQYVANELRTLNAPEVLKFWKEYLLDVEPLASPLVIDPSSKEYVKETVSHSFTDAQSLKLLKIATNIGVSPDIVFLALFHHTLCLLQNAQQCPIGVVTNNRLEVERGDTQLGLFLNTVPFLLAKQWHGSNIQALLEETAREKHRLTAYQDYPYSQICKLAPVSMGRLDTLYNYVHFHIIEDSSPCRIEKVASYDQIEVPIQFEVIRKGDAFKFELSVNRCAVSDGAIYKLQDYLNSSVEALCNPNMNPELQALPTLSPKDKQRIPSGVIQAIEYSEERVEALFEEQVKRTPHNIAVRDESRTLTYAELEQQANALAGRIRLGLEQAPDMGQSEVLIPVIMDRCIEFVVSILGVLKAGAAYVPISTTTPDSRIAFILEDTGAKLVLTTIESWTPPLEGVPVTINVDAVLKGDDKPLPMLKNTLKPLAAPVYCIYTSGTTGRPKGVIVEHKQFANLIQWYAQEYNIEASDRFLVLSALSFDLTQKNLFTPLITGGSVSFATRDSYEPDKICRYIADFKITIINCAPSSFYPLVEKDPSSLSSLRYVLLGGEDIDYRNLEQWLLGAGSQTQLINMYGPTECTDIACSCEITRTLIGERPSILPIGKAMANVSLYVVNQQGQLSPYGIPGELYIGGKGVSRGYWNRPELTEDRFVESALLSSWDLAATRFYKTGDLVRWREDGMLEFLGRNDFQVKIRGHRIEVAEVENVIKEQSNIDRVVVTSAVINGQAQLVAYCTIKERVPPKVEVLRKELSRQLPPYMIPSFYVFLEELPLTIHGKIDRQNLPAPEMINEASYVAPKTDIERALCNIWKEALQVEQVGTEDSFYMLGGHSINALKVVAGAKERLNLDLRLSDVLRGETISNLLARHPSVQTHLIPVCDSHSTVLSYGQERMNFIDKLEEGSVSYNIPFLARLRSNIDLSLLSEALSHLVQRHPIFCARYKENDFGIDEIHWDACEQRLVIEESGSECDVLDKVQSISWLPFDLEVEAPIKMFCYSAERDCYLFLLWHHIAFDGWSRQHFLYELEVIYKALLEKRPHNLPHQKITYGDYAAWQKSQMAAHRGIELQRYWQKQLDRMQPLELIDTVNVGCAQESHGIMQSITMNRNTRKKLRDLAQRHSVSENTVMLSLYYLLLRHISSQEDITIGMAFDNRENPHTHNIIGLFSNFLPLRVDLANIETFAELLSNVQHIVADAKAHEDMPFEKIVSLVKAPRGLGQHPIFQVSFGSNIVSESTECSMLFEYEFVQEVAQLYAPAKLDLDLYVSIEEDQLIVKMTYHSGVFQSDTIRAWLGTYQQLVEHVTLRANIELRELLDQL